MPREISASIGRKSLETYKGDSSSESESESDTEHKKTFNPLEERGRETRRRIEEVKLNKERVAVEEQRRGVNTLETSLWNAQESIAGDVKYIRNYVRKTEGADTITDKESGRIRSNKKRKAKAEQRFFDESDHESDEYQISTGGGTKHAEIIREYEETQNMDVYEGISKEKREFEERREGYESLRSYRIEDRKRYSIALSNFQSAKEVFNTKLNQHNEKFKKSEIDPIINEHFCTHWEDIRPFNDIVSEEAIRASEELTKAREAKDGMKQKSDEKPEVDHDTKKILSEEREVLNKKLEVMRDKYLHLKDKHRKSVEASVKEYNANPRGISFSFESGDRYDTYAGVVKYFNEKVQYYNEEGYELSKAVNEFNKRARNHNDIDSIELLLLKLKEYPELKRASSDQADF